MRSEHAIGVLKGRFSRLQELLVRLSGQTDFDHATSLVLCCCVLHPICCQMEDPPLDCAERRELTRPGSNQVPTHSFSATESWRRCALSCETRESTAI